ncbi:MAG: VWA domain-containing protein [Clostridia bacterium]|nr:VWA domain-containing protein [Clostridia bacterium]
MKNVSFDNPWLFLLAIPLILLILIPFFIAIRKENRQKTTVASLVIHMAIVVLVCFAAAGTMITEIKTETTVYVVADVSYSSDRNLDLVDQYIEEIRSDLPRNTKLGVICFGKEAKELYLAGEEPKSVKDSIILTEGKNEATDISSALLYASSDAYYPQENIKKMILITDGKDTMGSSQGDLISAVGVLEKKGIELDAIFLDNNLKEGQNEIQISDILGTSKVFSQAEAELKVLLRSNYESKDVNGKTSITVYEKPHSADASEYKALDLGGELKDIELLSLLNTQTIKLPKRTEGVYDYKIVVTPANDGDYTEENNTYTFTQEVSDDIKVLVISGNKEDAQAIDDIYTDVATLDTFVVDLDKNENSRVRKLLEDGTLKTDTLPYTIETLTMYDEVIVSNVDIRIIPNVTSFVHYLDVVVAQFGKGLITMGNLEIQNRDDDALGQLKKLSDMLPVSYGNKNEDKKLYTFVLDTSHSINQAYKFRAIKETTKKILSILDDGDYVSIVSFSGEVKIEVDSTELGPNRADIEKTIDNLQLGQGTLLGTALNTAYYVAKNFDAGESRVMLISDGKTSLYDVNARDVAKKMKLDGIVASTINVATSEEDAVKLLEDVAKLSGGKSYELEDVDAVEEFIYTEIADDLTETIVEQESPVHVKNPDPILNGIKDEPAPIFGYVQTDKEPDATVYLTVDYQKNDDPDSVVRVPLYSTRNHVNGKVATFASALSNDWLKGWDDEFKKTFFVNMLMSNLPDQKVDYPYTVQIEKGVVDTKITVTPAEVRSDAKAVVIYKSTENSEPTRVEMSFDSQKFFCNINTEKTDIYDVQVIYIYEESPGYLMDVLDAEGTKIGSIEMENGSPSVLIIGEKSYILSKIYNKKDKGINGKYTSSNENGNIIFTMTVDTTDNETTNPTLTFVYTDGEEEKTDVLGYNIYKGNIANAYVQVPYLAEYDAYTTFTPSILHASIEGEVVNGSGLKVEVDEDRIELYEKPLAMYFLALAAVLFVADVAIRVIKVKKKKKGVK